MSVILFEDGRVDHLYPVTLSRPAFAISCGSFRLFDLVSRLDMPVSCIVREHLRAIHEADFPDHAVEPASFSGTRLLVNARIVPKFEVLRTLKAIFEKGKPCVVKHEGCIAAALLGPDDRLPLMDPSHESLSDSLENLNLEQLSIELPMFEYPHDIIRHHLTAISGNLDQRLSEGDYKEIADGVFVADDAKLGEYLVTDTRDGPILLESGATVGSHCCLTGPVHIGPNARVIEYAALKDCVTLGHTTKIGGEIEASIVEPYTNKQHHGFMGHSYLGSWINLGAGTCNSDLKNTYGQVNMEYQVGRVASGMQFLGCIVGDYAKSAINTGIFTGKTVGVCSMLYGFVTTNVPSFVNYARSFGQVTETPVDVMIHTQARMFERRQVKQRPCDIQLLRDMYELTRHERQMAGEPLAL